MSTPENLSRAYQAARLKSEHPDWTYGAIGKVLGCHSTHVARLMKLASREGIHYTIAVPPPATREALALRDLGEEMRAALHLRDVVLVAGRDELVPADDRKWAEPPDPALATVRQAVWRTATHAAADYLARSIRQRDVLCLAWGDGVHAVIHQVRPEHSMPNLTIVPMLGVLSEKPSSTEANSLVEQMAAIYLSRTYYLLPVPAIVRDPVQHQVAVNLPVVNEVLAQIKKATFVVTSVGPPDPEGSTLVRLGLLSPHEIREIRDTGMAVGEICANWCDSRGNAIRFPLKLRDGGEVAVQPIGLDLDDLKSIVRRGGRVMACIGGDASRIRPLAAAIRGRIVNVVVTDEATARGLLRILGDSVDS